MTLHVRDFTSGARPLAEPKPDHDEVVQPAEWWRLRVLVGLYREARRQRRIRLAGRQAAMVIRLNGGVLTDELERRIAKLIMGL